MDSDLTNGLIIPVTRHPGTRHFAPLFAFAHLPPHLQGISAACAALAQRQVELLPDSPELSAGLRKLLEAKDCFTRGALPVYAP